MKTINWNEAPKEATHHGEFEKGKELVCWYQIKGSEAFSWDKTANSELWGETCWKSEDLTASNESDVTFTPRPIYTQEMRDTSEPLSVGMEVLYYGQKRIILLAADSDGDYVTAGEDGVYDLNHISQFDPLAPQVKLEDGKAYQFDLLTGVSGLAGIYSDSAFHLCGESFSISDCSNIKLLTVGE